MKEYLIKNIRGDYVTTDHHSGFQVEDLIEIPEGAELMFTNDCDQGFLPVFAKEDDGVVFVSWNGDWSVSKWESIKTLAKHFSNEVLWKRGDVKETEFSVKPVKSDGGSSSYYFTTLPKHLIKDIVDRGGIEIKDIVRYCFDNDADCKDIIKALKRIRENLKGGGKEGVDNIYDANKICFFAEELRSSLKECSKNV